MGQALVLRGERAAEPEFRITGLTDRLLPIIWIGERTAEPEVRIAGLTD
ncbi:MAG: hypothetical protein ACUVSY_18150 [Roseiflexus sp.]